MCRRQICNTKTETREPEEVQRKQESVECKQQRPKATTKQYLKNDVSNGRAGVATQAVDRVELNPTQILIYVTPFNQSITVAPSHLLIEFSIDNRLTVGLSNTLILILIKEIAFNITHSITTLR
jgi:hypothetical protein